MPQKIVCGDCGYIFYEGDEVRQPLEIIYEFDKRCPLCGKNLGFCYTDITLTPLMENREKKIAVNCSESCRIAASVSGGTLWLK